MFHFALDSDSVQQFYEEAKWSLKNAGDYFYERARMLRQQD
jgi:hypothetical protein